MKTIKHYLKSMPAHKKSNLLSIALLVFILIGCSRNIMVTTYYLLDYYPAAKNEKLILERPIPAATQVTTFKIPRSFDSIRIIARFSSHQINYYRYSLWAVRPQIAVADLIVQHINAYTLFHECQREFLHKIPDYEITGEIYQIELYDSDDYAAAHLKMVIELYDRSKNERVVIHEFDEERSIPVDNMTVFAKALSDIINIETENFLEKVVLYFYPPEEEETEGAE